jgi:hypothetical protein
MKRRTFLGALGALFLPTVAVAKTIVENKITPPTEEEDFYQFFLNFNGFPINEMQKIMFNFYKNEYTADTYGRRIGVSTFMLTLAAWEAFKGKTVVHFSSYSFLSDMYKRRYQENIDKHFDGKSSHIDFADIKSKNMGCKMKKYDVALFDQSDLYYHEVWTAIVPSVERHLRLNTAVSCEGIVYGNYIPIIKKTII